MMFEFFKKLFKVDEMVTENDIRDELFDIINNRPFSYGFNSRKDLTNDDIICFYSNKSNPTSILNRIHTNTIVDIGNQKIIARSIPKMNKDYSQIKNFSKYQFREMYDGDLIHIFFYDGTWQAAVSEYTNLHVFINNGHHDDSTYRELFNKTLNQMGFHTLTQLANSYDFDPHHTYVFDLSSPINNNYIKYSKNSLNLVAEIDNSNGTYCKINGGRIADLYGIKFRADNIHQVNTMLYNKSAVHKSHDNFVGFAAFIPGTTIAIKIESECYSKIKKMQTSNVDTRTFLSYFFASDSDKECYPEIYSQLESGIYKYMYAQLHQRKTVTANKIRLHIVEVHRKLHPFSYIQLTNDEYMRTHLVEGLRDFSYKVIDQELGITKYIKEHLGA